MYISSDIAERIKTIAKLRGVAVRKLLSDTNLGPSTMTNFKTSFPRVDNLAKIADYLDCSVDYLLGRSESLTAAPAPDTLSVEEQNLLALFHQLNPDGKEKVTDYVDDLIASGKYKKCAAPEMVSQA